MKRQTLVSLIVSGLAGAAIWALSSWATGHKEPWDADGLYYIAALVTAGVISGVIAPKPLWAQYAGSVAGQAIYELFFLKIGPLFILGLGFLLGYSLLFLAGAFAGSRARLYFTKQNIIRMQALELKIPPPAVAALMAAAMWGISEIAPLIEAPAPVRNIAATLIALAGGVFSIAGIISFRLSRTTINPMKPETSTSLVCSGIYRLTRNPMYVGLLFVLVAWAVLLSSAWALLGPLAFVPYINRFQIAPEERVLSALFGADYSAYQSAVRRWL